MGLLAGYRALRTENQASGLFRTKARAELDPGSTSSRPKKTLKFEIKYGDRRGRRSIIHPASG
jgi:hypothetical protein